MNDLVSEYQQYQDATAEGLYSILFIIVDDFYVCFVFQKKVKVVKVKKKNNMLKQSQWINRTVLLFFF